ncbi:MAG TPA: twin-arginine translocase subunit TatC [Candidatus Limnocylindrales bacterium]|nr:twin-arginine translocase subunit TatC [Candidatus Limnocylindrales bacterium]
MTDADALREGADQIPAEPPAPSASTTADEGKVMSLVDHLAELRNRLFKIAIAVIAGSIVGLWKSSDLIAILAAPAGGKLLNLGPGDAFAITLRVSLVTGIVLAMPVLLYQLWAFIAPGLTTSERRAVRPWIPVALLFFAIGVGIAFFVLPYAMSFLYSFATGTFVNVPAAGPYFDFVTTLFLAFGLIMEFPIVLVGLSRVNIVTSAALASARRYVFLGIVIFATAATPGGDLVSPAVLAATMYILFELTLRFIRRTGH